MLALGVDIGGTKVAVGVVDDDGTIVEQVRYESEADDVAELDRTIAKACNELASRHDVGAVGLAAAGFVSSDRVTVSFAPNIAWRDYPLAENVRTLLEIDVPVVVENDANAAGWAEFRFGAARDATDMLMLTLGTGLGGAIVTDSELVRGRWGMAGEVGHMRMVPDGELCGCGHLGCWEQYASGSALVREARAAVATQPDRAGRLVEISGGADTLTGQHVTQAAQEGDPLSVELLAWIGKWVGEGSATAVSALDPQIIVIGGGVSAAGDLVLRPAVEAFQAALPARGHRVEAHLVIAEHGNDAGIIGAGDLARR